MSSRNRDAMSRVKSRESRIELNRRIARGPRRARSSRRHRRGVLLLVVLSLLVLFMLLGTAFLMTSSQYKSGAASSAKLNRVGTFPTKSLDRALMQVVRDTDNPYSVVRYHSLLRDMYGADGFEGTVYSPVSTASFNPTVADQQVTRFAAATTGTPAQQLGPTQGQLIDIYVRQLAYNSNATTPASRSADDPLTTTSMNSRQFSCPTPGMCSSWSETSICNRNCSACHSPAATTTAAC